MKKIYTVLLCCIQCSTLCWGQAEGVATKMFSEKELQEDFSFWRRSIEKKHPLIYLYSSKKDIDHCFDSQYQLIKQPMTELDFIRLLTPVLGHIQDGHNYVIPGEKTLARMRHHPHLLPLEVKFMDEKLYVTQDMSASNEALTGLEITAINAVETKDILRILRSNLGRDGQNYQYVYAAVNTSFRYYYHIYYGFPPEFVIRFQTKDHRDSTVTLQGRSLDFIQKKTAKTSKPVPPPSGLNIRFIDSLQTAVLKISTFSPPVSNRKFRKEISTYFTALKKAGTQRLILDLRDNNGGNPHLVKYVLQYLMDHPFEQAKECRVVKNSQKELFFERTQKRWYPWYGIGTFQPKKNNFKGALYVLVNEGTFSSGVILCSVLRKYHRAVFVGTETGGNPTIMSGYLIKTSWTLPHTKIQFGTGTLSTQYADWTRHNGRGLIPDHIVMPHPDDIQFATDRCLHDTLKLISAAISR